MKRNQEKFDTKIHNLICELAETRQRKTNVDIATNVFCLNIAGIRLGLCIF